MILALDVGNTNIVLGCIDKGEILSTVRMRTEENATGAEYAIKILDMLQFMNVRIADIEGTIIGSVVPPVTGALCEAATSITHKKCLVVGPGLKTGLNLKIDDPGTLGADLAVGGVAAIEYYSTPAIVIDLGTANTMTVIDGQKSFLGGAIMPGIKLSFSALAAGTSLLPDIYISETEKSIGTNTVDCMRSGAILGTASMIDGMIDRMEEELGEKCTLIATGGLCRAVVPHCRHEIICDEELLLKGLWILYKKNTK